MNRQFDYEAVVVLGGCGFVGSALVAELTAGYRFHRIYVVDDLSSGYRSLLPDDDRIRYMDEDAAAIDLASIGNPFTVFYLCAAAYVPDSFDNPSNTIARNVSTLSCFLEGNASNLTDNFVYASSGEVYGSVPEGAARESNSLAATELLRFSPYAQSRALAESVLFEYATTHGRSAMILRLFNVIGPSATHPYILPELIRQAAQGGAILHGDLEVVRDMVWIGDTINAFIRASRVPAGGLRAVNVASGAGLSMRFLARKVAESFGLDGSCLQLDPKRIRPQELQRLVGNPELARSLLDWEPRVPVLQAVEMTVDWYRHHQSWPYETAGPSHVSR